MISTPHMMGTTRINPSFSSSRPFLSLARLLPLVTNAIRSVQAAPYYVTTYRPVITQAGKKPGDPNLWIYLGVAALLVLLGGAFAGLTIALMGQDEIYLQVIKTSGEDYERKNATKVLKLLNKGKHWVLVTLLLGNVITNETLPIVLDRSLGGGWPAVLGSTVLIVIFGEIAPQSVCVRYGLPIGAWMAPFVLGLMYILAPIAWPTAKLLDWLLGEDHGTVYKKSGLKTLVSLHRSLGEAGQQLNQDEVTIISAVLDLKDKSVGNIMTPMEDVFTLSLDDVLDEETMDLLLSQGYSRIPVHHPDNSENFVGMLLVKMLITYDPEDAKPVRDFALATLPETAPNTSCLDIVNFFQEGKSHMVLVSAHAGDDHGALGVVTLEDVIEELIGEEIIDESDVFIDVHKAIRRLTPAPRTRIDRPLTVTENMALSPKVNGTSGDLMDINEGETLSPHDLQREDIQKTKTIESILAKPKPTAMIARRRSSATNSLGDFHPPKRPSTDEIREHLKHLGPSNLASRPKTTRYASVKIKPGTSEVKMVNSGIARMSPHRHVSEYTGEFQTGLGEGVLRSGGKEASDGVQAVQQTLPGSPTERRPQSAPKGTQASSGDLLRLSSESREANGTNRTERSNAEDRSRSRDTIRSLPRKSASRSRSPNFTSRGPARSGSITENIIDTHGIRKVVLETTSSSSNEEEDNSRENKSTPRKDSKKSQSSGISQGESIALRGGGGQQSDEDQDDAIVKKRRRRKKNHARMKSEEEPLLS